MIELVKKILDFIDEKPVLATATMLPPLLTILFLMLGILFHWFENAAKYEPVFYVADALCTPTQPDLQLKVIKNVITAKFIPANEDYSGCSSRKKIYRYNMVSQHTDEISRDEVYNDYHEGKIENPQEFEIKRMKGLKVIASDISPDGYSFTVIRSTVDPNQEVIKREDADKIVIQKNGRTIDISPLGGGARYREREIKLLGWANSNDRNSNE